MSSRWSTQAQDGSSYEGSEGPGGQPPGGEPPVNGGAFQLAFDVQNVNYDASITRREASRRKRQKKSQLAADVNRHLAHLNTNGQQQHQQQHQQPQGPDIGAWQARPPPPPPQYPQDLAGLGAQFKAPRS